MFKVFGGIVRTLYVLKFESNLIDTLSDVKFYAAPPPPQHYLSRQRHTL